MARANELRPIVVEGGTAFVTLTKGYVAMLDAADVPLVEGCNWSALVSKRRNTVYACRGEERGGVKRMFLMHRVIAQTPDDMDTDHEDGNGLNNRRINLRVCSRFQNTCNVGIRSDNASGFKGVFLESRSGKWRAEIRARGRAKYLGRFDTPEEAHAAYSVAAAELHGEFARLA